MFSWKDPWKIVLVASALVVGMAALIGLPWDEYPKAAAFAWGVPAALPLFLLVNTRPFGKLLGGWR